MGRENASLMGHEKAITKLLTMIDMKISDGIDTARYNTTRYNTEWGPRSFFSRGGEMEGRGGACLWGVLMGVNNGLRDGGGVYLLGDLVFFSSFTAMILPALVEPRACDGFFDFLEFFFDFCVGFF